MSATSECEGLNPMDDRDYLKVSTHYDSVTDVWRYVMGDNLHYGYFEPEGIGLKGATDKLIDKVAALAEMDKHSHVLDVGCGIGQPAFHLHEKFGCTITGITLSARGVEIAGRICREKGYSDRIEFHEADALNNGLPSNKYDVAWVMESSHLMRDKRRLCEENYRVLKNGGSMLLCDLVLRRELTPPDLFSYRKEFTVLEKTFGKAKMATLEFYKEKMVERGFSEVEVFDISKQAQPTLEAWKSNLLSFEDRIVEAVGRQYVDEFMLACDITEGFIDQGLFGYGMAKGVKRT
jgi:27-O-demethylrifamycin SV methyltransferase